MVNILSVSSRSIISILSNKFEDDKYFQINCEVFMFGSNVKSRFVLCDKWKAYKDSSEISTLIFVS